MSEAKAAMKFNGKFLQAIKRAINKFNSDRDEDNFNKTMKGFLDQAAQYASNGSHPGFFKLMTYTNVYLKVPEEFFKREFEKEYWYDPKYVDIVMSPPMLAACVRESLACWTDASTSLSRPAAPAFFATSFPGRESIFRMSFAAGTMPFRASLRVFFRFLLTVDSFAPAREVASSRRSCIVWRQ